MMKILDRSKPHGTIYGLDPDGAVYTQGGSKFKGNGEECGTSVAADKPSPPKIESVEALEAAVNPPAATTDAPAAPVAVDARAQLEALHPAQLKKLVEEKGLIAATGAGSAKVNVDILMDALAAEA